MGWPVSSAMLTAKGEERKYLAIELFINKEAKIKDLKNSQFIHIAKMRVCPNNCLIKRLVSHLN